MKSIDNLISGSINSANRIVVTNITPFNPKNKKQNVVLADIRDKKEIEVLGHCLEIDLGSNQGSWMSPIDININFLEDKSTINCIGIVLGGWLRCNEWEGDYSLKVNQNLHAWLLRNGVTYYESQA